MNRYSSEPGSSFVPLLLLGMTLSAGAALAVAHFTRVPAPVGVPLPIVNAEPRPALPPTEPTSDETKRIQFFKAAKGSVVNVDIVFVQRQLDMSLIERQFGSGSGFIWDDQGHVVTNFHVIKDAVLRSLDVRVTLSDRTSHKAKIVGFDADNDLAVLRIDANKALLKPVPVGSSKKLEVGQNVFAIGNPFGQSLTLTQGIISALDREIQSVTDRVIRGVIQTDAALNPGNSGGPLYNKDGQLIGVNTAIRTTTGGNVGIGFAIPVDTVNEIVPVLIKEGKLPKPSLGMEPLRDQITRQVGFERGVMIHKLTPGGAAAKAGLKSVRQNARGQVELGDVIVAVDGKPVNTYADLDNLIRERRIGDTVELKIIRDAATEMVVKVQLQDD